MTYKEIKNILIDYKINIEKISKEDFETILNCFIDIDFNVFKIKSIIEVITNASNEK